MSTEDTGDEEKLLLGSPTSVASNQKGIVAVEIAPVDCSEKKGWWSRFLTWIGLKKSWNNYKPIAEREGDLIVQELRASAHATVRIPALKSADFEAEVKRKLAEEKKIQAETERINAEAEATKWQTLKEQLEFLESRGYDIRPIISNGQLEGLYIRRDKVSE